MNGVVNIMEVKGTVLDPLRVSGRVLSALQSAGVKFLPNSNIAIGADTLISLTSGFTNFALGGGSLRSNTSGSNNTAIGGFNVLYSNTSGSNNTGVGSFAMLLNTTGSYNTALGSQSLRNANGNNNTAIGYNAGVLTVLGTSLTDVENSIFIGTNSKGYYPGLLTNAIVIGYNAESKGSNTAVWGNTSIEKHYFNGIMNFSVNEKPTSVTASGAAGEVRFANDGIYFCIANNTWRKASLNMFS